MEKVVKNKRGKIMGYFFITNNEINEMISEYKDEMYIERRKILEKYGQNNENSLILYYIYDENKENYIATICQKERSHEIIQINKNSVTEDIKLNSIIRKNDDKYVLEEETTRKVNIEIFYKYNELLEKQNEITKNRRKEGHIYEFIEKSGENIFLIDITLENSEIFEENKFEKNIFKNAKQDEKYIYYNGKYNKI